MVGIKLRGKVGEKGQLVIPKPIREQFNIQPDTEMVFDVEEEKIVLKKKTSDLEIFERFVNNIKEKKNLGDIDWDKEYYSQFD